MKLKSLLLNLNALLLSIFFTMPSPVWANTCQDSVASKLSPIQQKYESEFNEYSKSTREEWNREFAFEVKSIERDLSRGLEKWEVLQKLGFKKVGDSIAAPSYKEFLNNYLKIAKEIFGNSSSVPILPAVVMVRENQYLLLTPGVDPWPKDEGYRILSANEVFNIPFRAVLGGLKSGRFPLMEASHDAYHFVSFLMNPLYAKLLFENVKKAEAEKYPLGFGRRLYYLLEIISLPDPKMKKEISQFLKFPKKQKFQKYKDYFDQLAFQEVATHAQKLIAEIEKYYIDYGGGMSRSYEKHQHLNTDYENSSRNDLDSLALVHLLGVRRSDNVSLLSDQVSSIQIAVLERLLLLSKMPKEEFADVASRNMYTKQVFVESKGSGSDGSQRNQLRNDYRQSLESLIRLQVARIEYFTWMNATQFTIEHWMNYGLVLQVPQDLAFQQMLLDAFGYQSNLPKIFK